MVEKLIEWLILVGLPGSTGMTNCFEHVPWRKWDAVPGLP